MPNPIRQLWADFSTASPESKLRVRRILTGVWLLILTLLAIWIIRNQEDQLRDIADQLRSANRTWLVIAIAVESVSMGTVASTYHLILQRLGHRISVPFLYDLHVQRAGVNFAAPFGGAATAYTWVERLGRKQVPPEDAMLALGLRTLCVYLATLIVVVITFAISGRPLAALIGIAASIAIVFLGFVAARKGRGDWALLRSWAQRLPARLQGRVLTAIERFKTHELVPRDLVRIIGVTLFTRACTIVLIYCCVRALDVSPSIYALFVAYVGSFVAARLVPVLYGMGAVEGSLAIALQRGGVPAEAAVGAALLVRFFDFLAPSLIGLALYAWAERKNPRLRISAPGTLPAIPQIEEPEDL